MGRLQKGINDLKTWCEENGEWGQQLIQEWVGLDEFGNSVDVYNISYGSHKKVQWKCNKGHKWLAKIGHRTSGKTGCPECVKINSAEVNRKSRLSNRNILSIWCQTNGEYGQQILQEWVGVDENNNPIEMYEVSYGSEKKVQWKCSKGHTWTAIVSNRTTKKMGCPYCSGRRATGKNSLTAWCQDNGEYGQQLLQEWVGLDEDNIPININDMTYGSIKKVQWQCTKGHRWAVSINSRTCKKTGCIYCYRSRAVEKCSFIKWCQENNERGKQLLNEWTGLDENNNPIEMYEVSYGSEKKVQWKCSKGHTWTAQIAHRTISKTGCPYCTPYNTSFPEQFIYHSLRQLFPHIIHRGKYKGYEYDITIPELRLCIEYSGYHWHKDKLYTRDEEKKKLCKKYGVNFLQIYANYRDTKGNIVNDSYTKNLIIYKEKSNKSTHINKLTRIVKFILEQYDPKHTIAEINFVKAELEANKIIQNINNLELEENSTNE